MKTIFLGIILSLISSISYCQLNDTIYFDTQGKVCSNDNFNSYRIASQDKINGLFILTDYYSNGSVESVHSYKTDKGEKKFGESLTYYDNGQIKSKCNFTNNKENGTFTKWFRNGSVDQIGLYSKGKKEGLWSYYFKSGKVSAEINYKKNKIISERYLNEDGTHLDDVTKAYKTAEYPGGLEKLRLTIADNLKYPVKAQKKGVDGKVYVTFIIDPLGNMTSIEIAKSLNPELDDEALRVVNLLEKKWVPGKKFNRPYDISFTLPVNFELTRN
ncbi:energy transducer TonB [Labilibacter marinus]|uniref:energy transducer TonB n=1 Tax=Labilibacter marinus TaxID=1477105 RepID=UPI00094FAE52|nr:energy transducer TonB [Labilibacter marinus]